MTYSLPQVLPAPKAFFVPTLSASLTSFLALVGLNPDLRTIRENECQFSTDEVRNGKRKHGRIDSRKYFVITEGVEELLKDTAFEGLCHSVGMVIRERRIVRRDPVTNQLKMECSTQEVYYISDWDDRLSAQEFAGYVRDHWAGCEMIHYVP